MSAEDFAMRVEDLHVRYGRFEAVKGVSFAVRRGRCLGIAGESGCGKSSLARAILGLEPDAASGRVLFGGMDVLRMGRAERREFRRRAQIVFQDTYGSLNPRMKAGEAIAEVLRVHGIAHGREASARAAEWLETVGLTADYAERFPHEMSGGQRQRVNIARALCVGAELLVADEPASALDVGMQAQIMNLLRRLQRERGITWLLIGHDLAAMRYLADDLLVMREGRVVAQGDAAELLANPPHPYLRELLAAVPDVPRALARRAAE